MDWKIELVAIPVTDVDRAKDFYVSQVGFNADHDHQVSDDIRFVQLTPPGSACSDVQEFDWGSFVFFSDPDGNRWAVQQLPRR
jgi:predicted enzyme related to lactoylglutathione lyase